MNKEIVKRLKDSLDYEFDLSFNDRKELLSYIEQLEKELKEEQEENYKQSEWLVKKQKKIEQLENNRDKAINYADITIELIEQQPTEDDTWILDRLKGFKNILKGDSDE